MVGDLQVGCKDEELEELSKKIDQHCLQPREMGIFPSVSFFMGKNSSDW